MSDVFLLTKPSSNPRTELCLELAERSDDAKLFLLGDGVYSALGKAIQILPADKVYACKEDLLDRDISAKDVSVLGNFYGRIIL